MRISKRYILFFGIALLVILVSSTLTAGGNQVNPSFQQAKKWLEADVYYDNRYTLYCGAEFNADKQIKLPEGFQTDKYKSRSERIEWEHVVPAENFGRTFSEWRDGHPDCQELNGKAYKGRKCAEKVNTDYQFMQADMYNLYPAIGSVNAQRSNYNFTQFQSNTPSSFGNCQMKIQDKKVEPPPQSRGVIGRTYLYFEDVYPRFKMSDSNRQLMQAWDKMYPVDSWECQRACRIEKIQRNQNKVVRNACDEKGLWPKGDEC